MHAMLWFLLPLYIHSSTKYKHYVYLLFFISTFKGGSAPCASPKPCLSIFGTLLTGSMPPSPPRCCENCPLFGGWTFGGCTFCGCTFCGGTFCKLLPISGHFSWQRALVKTDEVSREREGGSDTGRVSKTGEGTVNRVWGGQVYE